MLFLYGKLNHTHIHTCTYIYMKPLGKNNFAEVSKILDRYGSKNNFTESLK